MTRTWERSGGGVAESRSGPVLSAVKRYGVAVIAVGVAFGVRYVMSRILGQELPFTLFIAAALVAAWYGGAATGIVALMLGLVLADYFFVGTPRGFGFGDADSWVRIVRYLFTALLGIGLIEVLHRARRRTEEALRQAREEASRREQSEANLREAHDLLREHAARLDRRVEERTAALQANVSSLREILYNIAHCLRAPLRASASFSQIFLQEYGPQLDAAGKDYIAKIRRASERMDALTKDLLDYGEVVQKGLTLDHVNLKEVVNGAVAGLRARIEKLGAEVFVDGTLPEVRGHSAILKQIVVELLDNAMKFARADTKPSVRIRAERRASGVRLWVEDNGIGIERQYHDRIFGVFEQVRPTEHADGTGIGLAIVKQGMQRQGGDAGVESEPGVGSRFWLEFPDVREAHKEREPGWQAKVFSA